MILKSILITVILVVVITLATRWAVKNYSPAAESLYQGGDMLSACPDKPNCVSTTLSDDAHHIAAIQGDEAVFTALKTIIAAEERVSVINSSSHYLHAEFRTKLLGYVDDLEILHSNGEIQIRSASRLGKSDFGVNRKRVLELVAKLKN